MTDGEKKKYPSYKTTEGFLRAYEYQEAFKIAFDKATVEDIELTLELPNFNYEIFEQISGISKQDFDVKLGLVKCCHPGNGHKYCPHCGKEL